MSSLLQNYNRHNVEFEYGNGIYLYDKEGREYLDFLSGIAVTGFGHSHPRISKAVEEQVKKLWHVSNLFKSEKQEKLAEILTDATGLSKVFFCNSGTEANEAAIKFARLYGKERFHIITALGGFHGRTMGSLSATGQYSLWTDFKPILPGFSYVPFNDPDAIEHSINENTIAVMLEPIQGEHGVIIPSEGYLKKVREICDRHELLLILDEVQTGTGRTGRLFAYQWEDVEPDMITFAKGIANGFPLGGVILNEKTAAPVYAGCHGSTFGGNPVAISAAIEVISLLSQTVLGFISFAGEKIIESIESLHLPQIKEIRGKGLMIGIELNPEYSAKKTSAALLKHFVISGTSGDSVIRILPPYLLREKEIKTFCEKLYEVFSTENLIAELKTEEVKEVK